MYREKENLIDVTIEPIIINLNDDEDDDYDSEIDENEQI